MIGWLTRARVAKMGSALVALVMTLTLAACASSGPYHSSSDGADNVLMLKGHDAVAYFTLGRHTLGKPDVKATHEGATYRFASEEHKALFIADAARYVP